MHDTSTETGSWLFHCLAHWYWYVKIVADNSFNNKQHANVSETNNDVPRDSVPCRTLYPSLSLVLTTAPLVPGTAAVSRLRTLNRFTLADVSWSRLRKMGDGVDEDGRRRRRLPSENKGFDVRSADNTLLTGCAATGTAAPSGGCKRLNSETDRQTDRQTCTMQSRRAKESQETRGWRHF